MRKAWVPILILAILLCANITVPFVWADWPMCHHDLAHTGAVGHLPVVPTQTWNFSTLDVNVGYSSPAVVDGMVYVSFDGVYALDAATGKEIWHYPGGPALSSPAVVDGVVFVSSLDRHVYAIVTNPPLWLLELFPPLLAALLAIAIVVVIVVWRKRLRPKTTVG